MIGPNSSTQCQNKSKHSISFDNIATLLPSFRSGPLAICEHNLPVVGGATKCKVPFEGFGS